MPFSDKLYATPLEEAELGLATAFRPSDAYIPERNRLDETLQRYAEELMREDPPDLELPSKGLLSGPLIEVIRNKLNMLLGPTYAEGNALHQQVLLSSVAINESNEPLVDLRDYFNNRRNPIDVEFSAKPFHLACGDMAGKERIWMVRENIAINLGLLFSALNKVGIRPYIEDCLRTTSVQEGLLLRRITDVARQHSGLDPMMVKKIAGSLTASVPGLAGHMAGAAIDARYMDIQTGKFHELGNEYAMGGIFASIDCPYITWDQYESRMIFATTMRMSGMRLLPTENWHASSGDRGLGIDEELKVRVVSADSDNVLTDDVEALPRRPESGSGIHSYWKAPNQRARFGPIKSFNQADGKIVPYDPAIVDQPLLTDEQVLWVVEQSRLRATDDPSHFAFTDVQVANNFREKRASGLQ